MRWTLTLATAVVLVAGCTDQPADQPDQPAAASPSVGQSIDETVDAVLGGVPLTLEVADDAQERAIGLMGRTEVPAGTGMVFRYDDADVRRFYMFDVDIPLRAAFVRDGVVVFVVDMPPCPAEQPGDCPTYGPDEPVDTVVETAPATLPDVAPGDRLELTG